MNILRHPQESVVNTFQKLKALNFFRIKIKMIVHSIFPLVLLTGFFTAGTNAGISCNTFPWVGEHWFYTKNHFFVSDEIPFWRNFTENKLICQVNHRTLATLMTLWTTFVGIGMIRLVNISFSSKTSIILLILSLWT